MRKIRLINRTETGWIQRASIAFVIVGILMIAGGKIISTIRERQQQSGIIMPQINWCMTCTGKGEIKKKCPPDEEKTIWNSWVMAYRCQKCGKTLDSNPEVCPNCGAENCWTKVKGRWGTTFITRYENMTYCDCCAVPYIMGQRPFQPFSLTETGCGAGEEK